MTGELVQYTIQTAGTKDADANGNPGPWAYPRDYFLWLPPTYDKNKAYPLVLEAPGCGGTGKDVYPLNGSVAEGVDGTVIRVGLSPPPNDINHATAPGVGCFDYVEGDDSVDWPFYEAVIDTLNTELCYDENRVFAVGNGGGGKFTNELGCKYAGDTEGYAIRGVVGNSVRYSDPLYPGPTCSGKPMAGMWIWETWAEWGFDKETTNRAIIANGCTIVSTHDNAYDNVTFENYPIGGGQPDDSCKKILGCQYPLVVCPLPGNGLGSHDNVVNPAFATFLQSLAAP